MVNKFKKIAALFDLDGVVVDSETEYSNFWKEIGNYYLPHVHDFASKIKGTTLSKILDTYFQGNSIVHKNIIGELLNFEKTMSYKYVPGIIDFITDLKYHEVVISLVTSSNQVKMNLLFDIHPDLKNYFDIIITSEDILNSKPDPECYLLAASLAKVDVWSCYVFEDSFVGLQAGKDAGMAVIGISTTYPVEDIINKADLIINDFIGFKYDDMLQVKKI